MSDSLKGYGALRKGRHSSPGADYFITICLQRPSSVLGEGFVRQCCLTELRRLESDQAGVLRCAVIMPDHLHLLITLGNTISLSEAIRLLKGRLTPLLRRHGASWQQSFYDHCLHPEEDRLPVFLYIFLNPYRKRLIPVDEPWPGYFCSAEDWDWFGGLTKKDCPEPAWLA
jgi:REP element-mobilizing transposase RayT